MNGWLESRHMCIVDEAKIDSNFSAYEKVSPFSRDFHLNPILFPFNNLTRKLTLKGVS